jgi:hypothetical protein
MPLPCSGRVDWVTKLHAVSFENYGKRMLYQTGASERQICRDGSERDLRVTYEMPVEVTADGW